MIARSALLQLFPSRWDREFESAFLQRRVSNTHLGVKGKDLFLLGVFRRRLEYRR